VTTDVVTRTVSRAAVPFVQLFGLYVIAHGGSSAGGGFQGGVILATSLILLIIAFDLQYLKRLATERTLIVVSAASILTYAGIGLVSLLFGANYLDYGAVPLPLPVPEVRGLMIEVIEAAIGFNVTAVMTWIVADMLTKDEENT
jgi:multicomponent Na+:H+ antiporter subunit B